MMGIYQVLQRVKGLKIKLANKLIFSVSVGHMGRGSLIAYPAKLNNPKGITVSDGAVVNENSWLYCCEKDSRINICSDAQIGHYFHCVAMTEVRIEESVLIADRVFISDCSHEYRDINQSVKDAGLAYLSKVNIGAGSWIGEGACILGANVGKHCVIGANAVVTHDISDYSVAAGVPARVISRYDPDRQEWIKADGDKA